MASKPERTRFTPRLISLAVASCFATGTAYAQLPTGAHSMTGIAGINTVNGTMTVTTNASRSIVNWQTFSIGSGATVAIQQPGASSANLNRVVGSGGAIDPSVILGALQSNGRVFLLNPAGIVFGAGAQVDVAGLVASTLRLSDTDFLANRLRFTDGAGAGSVVNNARATTDYPNAGINARDGGSVYFVGASVTNNGLITTPKGEVVLAAGNSVELVNPGTPNLRVEITAPDNEARNLGSIVAEAGRVGIYAGLISHSGTTRADSAVATEDGRIVLKATKHTTIDAGSILSASGPSGGQVTVQSGDTTLVSGAISATGSAGKGGTVRVLGNVVALDGNASIDVSGETGGGTALVGGDFRGKNPSVQNAFRTYFGPNAKISADAIGNGDGGTVIVWSDNATRANGTISARGGSESGNGGFVEVSSRGWLDFHAKVDTRAPKGRTGTLLLDPADVCIYASDPGLCPGSGEGGGNFGSSGNPSIFTSSSSEDSFLSWGSISGGLASNNVIVTTSNGSATGSGNINIVEDSPDLVSSHMLMLVAHNDVNIGRFEVLGGGRIWNSGPGELRIYAGWNEAATPVGSLAGASMVDFADAAAAIALKNVGDINVRKNIDMRGNTLLRSGNNVTVGPGKIVSVSSFGPAASRMLTVEAGNAVVLNDGNLLVDVGGGEGPRNAILQVKSGIGGIQNIFGVISAQTGDDGAEARVVLSTPGSINIQGAFVGAEGGRGGIARVVMGANGSISIGSGSTVSARQTSFGSPTLTPNGAASQVTLIGNSILVDGIFTTIFAQGGAGTVNGGAASVNLIAAAGMAQTGAADSSGFSPFSVPPSGPISIIDVDGGIMATGGSGQTRGGDAAVTILAGGPLTVTDVLFTGIEARGGSGTGAASAGGNASTLLASSTAGVTLTRSHIGAAGGSGVMTGGSAVSEVAAAGGDLVIDGSGGTALTFFSQGGSVSTLGGTGGTAETNTFSTGMTKVIGDHAYASGGTASQGRGGDANLFGIALGGFEMLDAEVGAFAGFGGQQGGDALLSILASTIKAEETGSSSSSSPTGLIARGGSTGTSGTPGSASAVLVVTSPTGSVNLVNEGLNVTGGRQGSGGPFGSGSILLSFSTRSSGGFSVNGVEGAITGSPVGFFVNEQPAVPGENFFLVYGGAPPAEVVAPETLPSFLEQVVTALNEVADDLRPRKEETAPTQEEKDKKKKEAECR